MTTDLLKRLALLTKTLGLTFAGLFVYNLISFFAERRDVELVVFVIVNIGLIGIPIKRNSCNYDKWDITSAFANVYSILILYTNLLGTFGGIGFIFTAVSMGIVLTMVMIAIRVRYYPSHAYSPVDEEFTFSVDDEEVRQEIPLDNTEEHDE